MNLKLKKLLKGLSAEIVVLSLLFFPLFIINAQSAPCDPTKGICNPIQATSITGLIKTILEGVIKIGMPVIALAIIYCGFLFVSAQGKPEEIKKAKDALVYTLIGAAILLGAWALAQLVSETVLAL